MPQKRKPRPKPPSSRYWIFDAWDKTRIKCLKSTINDCYVTGLWQGGHSAFHDADLQHATEEITKILDRVERDNEDTSRHLSLIKFQSRLMLVWTHHGEGVTSQDPDVDIAKALKIKGFKRR